jgi:hypothetical protein
MESIILATNGRQGKNESTSGTEKTAINGWFLVFIHLVGE